MQDIRFSMKMQGFVLKSFSLSAGCLAASSFSAGVWGV